jgi:hypothetical protein
MGGCQGAVVVHWVQGWSDVEGNEDNTGEAERDPGEFGDA